MKKYLYLCIVVFVSALAFTSFTQASGSSALSENKKRSSKVKGQGVDQLYEKGKHLYRGKDKKYKGIKVCLKAGGDTGTSKLSRSSLKKYAKGSALDLAVNLYNCKAEEQQLANVYQGDDLAYLIYYLNKRYKLNLEFDQG